MNYTSSEIAETSLEFRESDAIKQKGRGNRVCMLAYAFYEIDTRIMQYASALVQRGDTVDVIALRRNDSVPEFETLNGVNIYRIQTRPLNERGVLVYIGRILRFFQRSALLLQKKHRENPYSLVHVHNVPDFLVFATAFVKWKRVPVILDIHDLLPELYASKFHVGHGSALFKLLVFMERCSAAFATHIIVANHLWHERLVKRSSTEKKCSVVRNCPDPSIFAARSRKEVRKDGKYLMIYPGSLNFHQGLDVAIRAFAGVAGQMQEAEFHIYGEGPAKPLLIALAKSLCIQDRIVFHDFVPSSEIAEIMATADLAIEPKRATSAFGNEALSTKILEFMCLGVPVVACRTTIHAYYYDDSIIQYYHNDDEAELSQQMLRLRNDPVLCGRLVSNANRYVLENTWDARKYEYLALVDSLLHSQTAF